jgi:hypothetical protein
VARTPSPIRLGEAAVGLRDFRGQMALMDP